MAVDINQVYRPEEKKTEKMTKSEMVTKMLNDQKTIREALKKGVSLKELEKTHGFRFAKLSPVNH